MTHAYGGSRDFFAAMWASTESSFEIFLLSRVGQRWILTGTSDPDEAEEISKSRPRVSLLGSEEETPLADLVAAHREHLARIGGKPDSVPTSLEVLAPLYADYLDAAVG